MTIEQYAASILEAVCDADARNLNRNAKTVADVMTVKQAIGTCAIAERGDNK